MKSKKRIFFIEGNIGSGKTTVIEGLKKKGYSIFVEPVKEWTEIYVDKDGNNILDKFYKDMTAYSFQLQILAMMTRWQNIRKALDKDEDIIFIERSIETDRFTFALNLKEENMSELEWNIYHLAFEIFTKETECHFEGIDVAYIYLKTESKNCYARTLQRGRKEEGIIPLKYLHNLQERHDDWLLEHEKEVHIIDGNKDKKEVLQSVIDIL